MDKSLLSDLNRHNRNSCDYKMSLIWISYSECQHEKWKRLKSPHLREKCSGMCIRNYLNYWERKVRCLEDMMKMPRPNPIHTQSYMQLCLCQYQIWKKLRLTTSQFGMSTALWSPFYPQLGFSALWITLGFFLVTSFPMFFGPASLFTRARGRVSQADRMSTYLHTGTTPFCLELCHIFEGLAFEVLSHDS